MLLAAYIDKIKYNRDFSNYILIIKNNHLEEKIFSFIITSNEAKKISLSKSNVTSNKLNIYDVFIEFLTISKYSFEKVEVTRKKRKVYSKIFLKFKSKIITLELFFVDALILSMKSYIPLFVDEKLFVENNNFFFSDNEVLKKNNIISEEFNVDVMSSSLEKLINDEKYELAAVLRDKIKSIKKN